MTYIATAQLVDNISELVIKISWDAPVDRPSTHSISLPATKSGRKLAARLVTAINAQKALTNPVIKTDVCGLTYIEAKCHAWGRHLNADLKRLGF